MKENLKTYPLLQAQMGVYIECMEHQGEIFYNIPLLYKLDKNTNIKQLQLAVVKAFCNHPNLFSHFEEDENGLPVSVAGEVKEFEIPVIETDAIENVKASLIQPFNLACPPLFQVKIIIDTNHVYLYMDIHHTLYDGTSTGILENDINKAYAGEELTPERISVQELANEENEARKSEAHAEGKKWYEEQFAGAEELSSDFLADKEKPELKTKRLNFHLEGINYKEVRAFCHEQQIKGSALFIGGFGYLLARYNGEEQALFSTVYNGRDKEEMMNTVGMFVKSYPVFAKFSFEEQPVDYLRNLQQQTDGSRKHSVYSYGDIVTELNINPAIMFSYQGKMLDNTEMCGCTTTNENLAYYGAPSDKPTFLVWQHGEGYTLDVEFPENKYSDGLICSIADAYIQVLKGMLSQSTLKDITLLSTEAEATLDSFFGPKLAYDDTQTIVSLFKKNVEQYPDNLCVNYKEKSYTYKEVDEFSDRIAAYIISKGITPENAISVMLNRSAAMVIVSLGIMKTGCAYQPLDPSYPADRLNYMMKDADARLLIADRDLRPIVNEYEGEVLFADELDNLPAANVALPEVKPEYTYILLYTSGSTGVPKGVMLSHANMVAYDAWYQKKFQLDHTCHTAPYASYGFDAFMIDTYPALACGASIYIVPEEIRLDMEALNNFITDNKISHTLMTTQVGCQFAMNMENDSLRYLLTGGEKILTFEPPKSYQLINAYGPTENTISITCFPVTEKLNNVPIGEANDNMRLYIVDKIGQRVPVGCAGELWAAGPQIGKGYLNLPEKTAESFIENPFATEEQYVRAYRTGDTVCWREDGQVLFMGRKDGQVKIRGFRIELKEVEGKIREFDGIKDVTVQAFDAEGGGKFIAAYIVADSQIDIESLNAFIMEEKPPYMVPAVTMQIEKIPLNVNQKVDKKALPKPEVKSVAVEESNVPMNVLEEQIKAVIAEVIHNEEFGVTTPLVYAGLTSISCIQLAVKIFKKFGVKIETKQFAKTGTLQEIENAVLNKLLTMTDDAPAEKETSSEVSSETSNLKEAQLTYPQQGVYYDCMKNPALTTYNIPFMISLPDGLKGEDIVKAVKDTVLAHQSLRFIFTTKDGEAVQKFVEDMPIEIPVVNMTQEELEKEKATFVRPFNLAKGPLFRFELVECDQHFYLLTDIHHLVSDGGSENIFLQEICARLNGEETEAEEYTYLQFATDQRAAEGGDSYQASKDFFAKRLSILEGASEIPTDLPKNNGAEHTYADVKVPVEFKSVESLAMKMGVTPMSFYLAGTFYTVSRYVNSKEVGLGTISNGRSNLKLYNTTGMFVNTLALTQEVGDQSVAEFIKEVAANFSETLTHEDYPFAQIAADFGFMPEIVFEYQVGVISDNLVNGNPVDMQVLTLDRAKFKIKIAIHSNADGSHVLVVGYDEAYYSRDLAERLAESLKAVFEGLIHQLDTPIKHISIMSETQKEEVEKLHNVALTETTCHRFYEPIEQWAETQGDKIALIATDRTLTYAEFNAEANRIAHALIAKGVKHGDRVVVLLPRDSRVLTTIFGISKAGAAYIPCDPNYPAERIQLILEDSEARFVVTTDEHMSEHGDKAINVDDLKSDHTENPNIDVQPDDLVYLIYTSGSTGRPKGVMLRHEGICNYLRNH